MIDSLQVHLRKSVQPTCTFHYDRFSLCTDFSSSHRNVSNVSISSHKKSSLVNAPTPTPQKKVAITPAPPKVPSGCHPHRHPFMITYNEPLYSVWCMWYSSGCGWAMSRILKYLALTSKNSQLGHLSGMIFVQLLDECSYSHFGIKQNKCSNVAGNAFLE